MGVESLALFGMDMGIPALQDIVVELPLLKSPEEQEKFMNEFRWKSRVHRGF